MTAEFDEAALVARLERERVLPVVVIERASDAAALADALVAGGCSLIEITLRTDAALDAIAALANHPSIVVGAGTVLNVAQAREAQAAGARFLVAPGFDSATLTHARASYSGSTSSTMYTSSAASSTPSRATSSRAGAGQ